MDIIHAVGSSATLTEPYNKPSTATFPVETPDPKELNSGTETRNSAPEGMISGNNVLDTDSTVNVETNVLKADLPMTVEMNVFTQSDKKSVDTPKT